MITTPIHITGAACSSFARFSGSISENTATVILGALEDAGTPPETVDALYVGNFAAELVEGQAGLAAIIAGDAGMASVPATKVEGVCASGSIALRQAVLAVAAGAADVAVAAGVEALTPLPRERRTNVIASALDQRVEGRLGLSFAAFFGLAARSYLSRHSMGSEELFAVVEHNLSCGASNPIVTRVREYDYPSYMESPFLADPLRVADACPTRDGAVAVVVSKARSREGNGRRPIPVVACEQASGSSGIADLEDLCGFEVVRRVSAKAYERAGITTADVDIVELHDAFSVCQLMELEDLGMFPQGRGLNFLDHQDRLYVNPSGGLLARGHPIGATGLAQVYEIIRQMRGESHHQHPSPRFAMAQCVGGLGAFATVTILACPE